MTNDCEDIRLMLVESAYDELDPMDERILETHLRECEDCARRREAFRAVRADLRSWDHVEAAPSRVTFVEMRAADHAAGSGRLRSWQRALAVAASFTLGFLLIAAAVNLELTHDDGGWTLRTSLLPRSAATTAAPEREATRATSAPVERIGGDTPQPAVPVNQPVGGQFRVMTQPELDSWLDQRLQARGIQLAAVGPGLELGPEHVQPVLEELLRQRDGQVQSLVREMLANAQSRQQQQLQDAMTGLYQTFDAQRTNDLLFLASELGLLQEATGQELQQTNAAIDYLIGLRAQQGDAADDGAQPPPKERQQ